LSAAGKLNNTDLTVSGASLSLAQSMAGDTHVSSYSLASSVPAVSVSDYVVIGNKLSSNVDRLLIEPEAASGSGAADQTATLDAVAHSDFEVVFVGNQLGDAVHNGIDTYPIGYGNNTGGHDTLVINPATSQGKTFVAIGAAQEARVEGRNYGETLQVAGVSTVSQLLSSLSSVTIVNEAAETTRAFADLSSVYAGTTEGTTGWDLVLTFNSGAKVVLSNLYTPDLQALTAGFLTALEANVGAISTTTGLTLNAGQAAMFITATAFNSTLFGNLTIGSYTLDTDQMGVAYAQAQLAALPSGMVTNLSLTGSLNGIETVTASASTADKAKVSSVTVTLTTNTIAKADYDQISGWGTKLTNTGLTVTGADVNSAKALMGDTHVSNVALTGVSTITASDFATISGKLSSGGLTVTGDTLAQATAQGSDSRVDHLTLNTATLTATDFTAMSAGLLTKLDSTGLGITDASIAQAKAIVGDTKHVGAITLSSGITSLAQSDYVQIAAKLTNTGLTVTAADVATAPSLTTDTHVAHVTLANANLTASQYTSLSGLSAAGKLNNTDLTVSGASLSLAQSMAGDTHVSSYSLASTTTPISISDFNTISVKLSSTGLTVTGVSVDQALALGSDAHVAHITLASGSLSAVDYARLSPVYAELTNTGLSVTGTPSQVLNIANVLNANPASGPSVAAFNFDSYATVSDTQGHLLSTVAGNNVSHLGANINVAPLATDDTLSVTEAANLTSATTVSGNVIANDADFKDLVAGGLTVTAVRAGAESLGTAALTANVNAGVVGSYGTLTLNANGTYSYALNNANASVDALNVNATLHDTFTYQVTDGKGGFDLATLDVTINGSNDAPTVAVTPSSYSNVGKQQVNVNGFTVNDAEASVDGSTNMTVTLTENHGNLSVGTSTGLSVTGAATHMLTLHGSQSAINTALGTLVSTSDAGYEGASTVTLIVDDGQGATNSNTVTVSNVDTKAPTVTSITNNASTYVNIAKGSVVYTVTFSETVTGITASDFTVGNGTVTSVSAVSGSNGTQYAVTVAPSQGVEGNLSFQVNAAAGQDWAGNDSVTLSAAAQLLDTKAPSAPTAKLSSVSDTGVANDNVSNKTTVTIDVAGLESTHTSATYTVDGVITQAFNGSSFSLSSLTANTSHTVVVNQTDIAGNGSANSASYSFTIDTIAPTLLSGAGLTGAAQQAFWNAQLQADGITVKLLFSESMDSTHMANVINNLNIQAAGYTVAVTNAVVDGTDPRLVTLTLEKAITAGVTTKVSYTDPTSGDDVSAVLQDIAGNDVASGLWTAKSLSVVNAATDSANVRVFDGGLYGGTANDTLTHTGTGNEFLSGGSGIDTINVTGSGNAASWLVAGYAINSSADASNLGIQADVATGQHVYDFTKIGQYSNSVFAQGETINVGSSHFAVNGSVLQITDSANETLNIDPDVIASNTSMQIGSGQGNETIIDSTDSTLRSDTVLYQLASTHNGQGVNADYLLASSGSLIASLETVLTPTTDNTFAVNIGGKTDTLVGVERLQFATTTDGTVNVALVGNAAGDNGYHSLAAMSADVEAGGNTVQAVVVSNDTFKTQDHNSVLTQIDGMFSTSANNHLALNLTPGSGSATELIGTSKVIFETSDANHPVTVLVVGADGYASIDAAMTDAKSGDVIYITDNALTAPTDYTVYKEGMVFMANSSTFNNQLTLELGYLEIPATANNPSPVQSMEIHNLFLLGTANISVNGNQLDNVIVGNHGDNIIFGNDGNDNITTGGGADMVYGGNGNDILLAQSGSASGSTLLSGGAGNDLLIDATTDNARVVMTGGAGADTFKVGSLSSDNGNLALQAVITDLSARNGDHLDFSQLLNGADKQVSASDVTKAGSYTGGNEVYNFTSQLSYASTSSHIDATGAVTQTQVDVHGTVQVNMTTLNNVNSALVVGATDTVAQDVYGAASLSSELQKLVPMYEHNPLG
jgi:VCBS repeat-containing protein